MADIVIINAKVFTSDKENPWAEAVAVKGNRIEFVGTNEEAKGFTKSNSTVIDAKGQTLTAGFIDSHFHLLSGSIWAGSAQLYDVTNKNELKEILLDYAQKNKTNEWVDGRGIKYGIVSSRQELDEIISDRPIYINAYDGHTSWANTKALEMAGILKSGIEASGVGEIVRGENGIATGELRETAMSLVADLIPKPDDARKRELLKMTIQKINASGITSIHNMNGDMKDLLTYAALEDSNEMTLRVYVPFSVEPNTTEEMLSEAVEMSKIQGEYVRGGAAKFFMDGVWESYTALNIEPYADNPDAKPDGIYSLEHFTRMAKVCDSLGLQIFVHCCGDGAVRRTLDGYQAIQKSNGKRDSRHRVEHIEVIHPDDLHRFKDLGVIASMQTSHAPLRVDGTDVWPARVGPQRWHLSFAWRTIKNAGAHLAFGSDWTVAPFDPMININAALNRELWDESNPNQNLTLEEVILGYTCDAAYAEFMENEKGQIKAGYLADLVLFSHDLFALNPKDILQATAVMTMVDGKIVFEA
jgi:predicted amidohydrolase YtcJ